MALSGKNNVARLVGAVSRTASSVGQVFGQRVEPLDFKGCTVIITGGSRGFGLAMARAFAGEGARLVLLARDKAELERASRDVQEHAGQGGDVLAIRCDVTDEGEIGQAIARAARHFGRVDVLVNNAGEIQVGPVEDMAVADFQEAIAEHVYAPLYAMRAAIPYMRKQGGGRIVNIASVGGRVAIPHLVPYCTSKFALVGLSDGMRAELAKDNIRVTTVSPGLMRTGSHLNATFKGQQRLEFTLFTLAGASPVASISADRAARQTVEACRDGTPELTISIQARLLSVANILFPNVVARIMALTAAAMPRARGGEGKQLKTGWESRTNLASSPLTALLNRAAVQYNELRGHRST